MALTQDKLSNTIFMIHYIILMWLLSLGVWGSAFSILFNRVLGVKDTVGGSTMEEELGKKPHTLPF